MGAERKVIAIAEAEVGYLEKKSNSRLEDKTANAGKNNYTKYGQYFGMNGQPWCDMFVDWCFIQAYGRDTASQLLCGGFSAYTPTSAQYYKNKGQWHSKPQAGDQIFFRNSERINHTGLVYQVSGDMVYTIEGNTSGASGVVANGGGVCKKSYAIHNSRIAGYGRPDYSIVKGGDEMGEWMEENGRWWYRHPDGSYTRDGWELIDGQWYLFDTEGWMLTGWQQRNGIWYYLCGRGCMENGWQNLDGAWYFMDESGAMRTGWIQDGGVWYCLEEDGKLVSGSWKEVNGQWYHLGHSGAMDTGLFEDADGRLYYLAADGHMCRTDASGALV